MDEMLNEESLNNISRRRKPKKKKLHLSKPAFLSRIGEDVRWYYDVRLWSPLILLLLILALLVPVRKQPVSVEVPQESISVEAEETEPVEVPRNPEAVALAKLADSVGAGRSKNVKTIIMWIAVNRAEDRANGYGQSLMEEIARPNQWQGYDEAFPYSEETYEIALEVLNTIAEGGLRPLDSDMLWLVLNDNGSVTVRNQFNGTAGQRWREKTVN